LSPEGDDEEGGFDSITSLLPFAKSFCQSDPERRPRVLVVDDLEEREDLSFACGVGCGVFVFEGVAFFISAQKWVKEEEGMLMCVGGDSRCLKEKVCGLDGRQRFGLGSSEIQNGTSNLCVLGGNFLSQK
jgi:hypothetical protein